MGKIKPLGLAFVLFLCLSCDSYGDTERDMTDVFGRPLNPMVLWHQKFDCYNSFVSEDALNSALPAYCERGNLRICSEEHAKHSPDFCGVKPKQKLEPDIQPSPKCLRFFDPDSARGRNFIGANLCSSEEERQSLLLWIKYLQDMVSEKQE